MGVPGLQTWLRKRYPEAFVPVPPGMAFDHVYIDMSSTLHQVIRRARTKPYFHYLLHRRLDEILAMAQPQQRVVLAMDGPAPLAKLLEQRRRRRREVERSARGAAAAAESAAAGAAAAAGVGPLPSGLTAGSSQQAWSSTVDALALQGGFRPPNPELSTLALTTGTRLMLEVHASLAAYICKKLADPATAHLRFEMSDSTVKGEGELKILSRLLHPDPGPDEQPAPAGTGDHSSSGSSDGSAGDGGVAERERRRQEETHLVLGADSDLLLMALVAGQRGVYILSDALESGSIPREQRKRRRQLNQQQGRDSRSGGRAGAGRPYQAAAGEEAAAAAAPAEVALAGASSSSSDDDEDASSSSGSDADESPDVDPTTRNLLAPLAAKDFGTGASKIASLVLPLKAMASAAAAQAAAQADEAPPPPLVAFSRDEAERLWREQHLAGIGGGQEEVTSLALDLMLLSTMASGNDYLPGIQGMQLSNKHRPGVWDLYCGLRQQGEWAGQMLVVRSCGCGGAGAGGNVTVGRDCPGVTLNYPFLTVLLEEYHRQRYVILEGGPDAQGGPGVPAGGADLSRGSVGSSGSGGSTDAGEELAVWGEESLAAAAAAADNKPAVSPKRRAARLPSLRGLEPQPEEYLQGLEWVLQMYCSGGLRDYRFAYDLAAPVFPELLEALAKRARHAAGAPAGGGASSTASAGGSGQQQQQQQQRQGAADRRAVRDWRSTQPLVPAACAMALLPRDGRMHAATALQHLMDHGGPLDEIYATCDDCTQLGIQQGSMGRELDGARAELALAQRQLNELAQEALAGQASAAGALPPPSSSSQALELVEVEVESLEAEVARLKVLMSAMSRRYQEHLFDVHPYKPFPTDLLEAAVASVPLANYPHRERKLAQFGREFVFKRAPQQQQFTPQQQQQQEAGQERELDPALVRVAAPGVLAPAEQGGGEAAAAAALGPGAAARRCIVR